MNDVTLLVELIPSINLVVLSALPVPFLMVNPSRIELIVISGDDELSYAC
jgi:hypothetical protein